MDTTGHFSEPRDPFNAFSTSPYAASSPAAPAPADPQHTPLVDAVASDKALDAAAETTFAAAHATLLAIIGGVVAVLTVVGIMILGWSTMFFLDLFSDPTGPGYGR